MAYRALYREYRPKTFSQVVGQEHITTVLKNQVSADHIAHAYLFCGTRGTGKTSTAKILARAVNCLDPQDGEPCMVCPACKAALEEGNGDILELDAASNNGVDDARAIIEQAQYAPLSLRRRVFIIDEAHMLTTSAFNALLKTLEEPPAHVLFILATTEPQKLPATIISRCQRFDFHRLSTADIVKNLKFVLDKAGAQIDEEGLLLIARAADGGMRDALSLADQCLSFIGDRVTKQDVYDVLGSMEEGFLFELADALIASDGKKALSMLDEAVRGGRDLAVFTSDLAAHFRALLLAKSCGRCENLLDCTADSMDRYLAQAQSAGETRLLLGLEALLSAQSSLRYLSSPRTLLESVLIRICRPEDLSNLDGVLARLERLEAGGIPAPAAQRPVPQTSAAPMAPQVPAQPSAEDFPEDLVPPPEEDVPWAPFPEEASPAPLPRPAGPKPAPAPKPTAPAPRPVPERKAPTPVGTTDAAGIWGAVLNQLYKENIMVHALAKFGSPLTYTDQVLTVGFDAGHATQKRNLQAPISFNRLQSILSQVAPGATLRLVDGTGGPATEGDLERAKALFGDKLIIKD